MATAYKILQQANPSTFTDWSPGTGKSWVISTLNIANVTSSSVNFSVYAKSGSSGNGNTANALFYNISISPNQSLDITIGITLAATDVLSVASSTANALTFTAFGSEIS